MVYVDFNLGFRVYLQFRCSASCKCSRRSVDVPEKGVAGVRLPHSLIIAVELNSRIPRYAVLIVRAFSYSWNLERRGASEKSGHLIFLLLFCHKPEHTFRRNT